MWPPGGALKHSSGHQCLSLAPLHTAPGENKPMWREIQAARLLDESREEKFYRVGLGFNPESPTNETEEGWQGVSATTEGERVYKPHGGWTDTRHEGLLQVTSEITRTWLHRGADDLKTQSLHGVLRSYVRARLAVTKENADETPERYLVRWLGKEGAVASCWWVTNGECC